MLKYSKITVFLENSTTGIAIPGQLKMLPNWPCFLNQHCSLGNPEDLTYYFHQLGPKLPMDWECPEKKIKRINPGLRNNDYKFGL